MTQSRLKELLHYSPDTGLFTRLTKVRGSEIGSICNTISNKGYIHIKLEGKNYRIHRLAMLYVYGSIPRLVDHIDQNKLNNRIDNLRSATFFQNSSNQCLPKNNTSGHIGVAKVDNRYQARIKYKGKVRHIGSYLTIDEAIQARKNAEVKYGFHPNHGKISPTV